MFATYETADGLLTHFTDQIHESIENNRNLDKVDCINIAHVDPLTGAVKLAHYDMSYPGEEPPTIHNVMKYMAGVVAMDRLVVLAFFMPTMAKTQMPPNDTETMLVIFGAGIDAYSDPSVLLNMARFPIAGDDEHGWDVGPKEFYYSKNYDVNADVSPAEIFLEEYHRIWVDESIFPDPKWN
jgi:hypothetical protein